ncbi:LysR family transcriptional regulator [Brevundimonas guildfordensis]|uniref:LysR family transcriptional regulator n=1 Tax=Brevundimonas guildfordensis TaxID=2762241 RepID=A0ABR8QWQ5_9CAUL|nr:LysR family transcriptional regulator [Brevundimonas guildfordensis]MBD7939969.1 LysR family transcriptional regulator [Brevundimonas guildfordensis]
MTRIDPQRLLRLAVLIKEGSFRKAADTLGITQPALSQSIAQLEDEVGVQLITRSARGVQPTVYGEALYGHARIIDSELVRATQQIQNLFAGSSGSLLIGSPTGGGIFIVAQAICGFMSARSDVNMRIIENVQVEELISQLHDRTIDLVVCPKLPEIALRGARAIRLLQTKRVLCVRKNHPMADDLSIENLKDYSFVCPPDDMGILSDIKSVFSLSGQPIPSRLIISNSISLAKDIVLNSDAFTIISDISALRESGSELICKEMPSSRSSWYYFVCRPEYIATEPVRAFLGEFITVCEQWGLPVHSDAVHYQKFGRAPRDSSTSQE